MSDLEISCVMKDSQLRITHVGLNGYLQEVITVVNLLLSRQNTAFTYKHGLRARVIPKQNEITKRWYLTTEPDSTRENNLDFLPTCEVTS